MAENNNQARSSEPVGLPSDSSSLSATRQAKPQSGSNIFVKIFRNMFGYRKTSLTFFVILTVFAGIFLSHLDNSLDFTIELPSDKLEEDILLQSWLDLQKIAKYEHTYGSIGNDFVHDYVEKAIFNAIGAKSYIEYDNDLNYTNNIIYNSASGDYNSVSYFESNNLNVRINGTNKKLPALLLSAHYDSVPSSFGVTDDGMGVASMLGVLYYYSHKDTPQPSRTIIFNFNNDEEFGLRGATSFLSHPWFKQIKYFLNLEGTGAGGKAMLFRGTDYGIVNHFKNVRYPYGTSLFQQGFNNRLIHSETDYKVYKEQGGLRGLDLAFYKPRDLYHTAGDNIKNIDIKSLWHMLSNSLDFVGSLAKTIDLDEEYLSGESKSESLEFAAFASFFNFFFSIPISRLVVANIILLVVIPVVSMPFLFIIFQYKQNWDISFVNVMKLPISLVVSIPTLNFINGTVIVPLNEFLPNSNYILIVATLFALFILLNYLLLNGINLIFSSYKVINHDEKLIVLIEISFAYWIILLLSTVKLANNKIGDDHTGEFSLVLLFGLQSLACLLGLVGWSFKESKRNLRYLNESEDYEPLLRSEQLGYGTHVIEGRDTSLQSSSISERYLDDNRFVSIVKSFGYDWSIQFLVAVPLSFLIIYNSGFLVLDGLNKSIQESLAAEGLIYKFIQVFAIALSVPFLPFVFKLNRFLVTSLLIIVLLGFVLISTKDAFNESNPLKLRFVQTIDLNVSAKDSYVTVAGREFSPIKDVLSDMPSLKESSESLLCNSLNDGMQKCTYKSSLGPELLADFKDYDDFITVDVLKNSSDVDYPFGLLSSEIKITAPKNRLCVLNFNISKTKSELWSNNKRESPVKTVIIYADKPSNVTTVQNAYSKNTEETPADANSIPEGFSRDKAGNYVYKNLGGINQLQLNKLDWDKDYHILFQWVPELVDINSQDVEGQRAKVSFNKLGVDISCFWADLSPLANKDMEVKSSIPAYAELLHYSPNYVSWANIDRGLVQVSKYVEI